MYVYQPQEGEGGKVHAAVVELEWQAEMEEFFDFDVDISEKPIARSMAEEPWSIAYFRELKQTHQSHYEQWGTMKGHIAIDGVLLLVLIVPHLVTQTLREKSKRYL